MMPTLDLGSNELVALRRGETGFTLIEVVVVLLLMGVVSALVVVNVAPDDQKQVRLESQRLASLFEQAGMEGQVSGNVVAWSSDGAEYSFQEQTPNGEWVAMSEDIYRPHDLPKNMILETAAVGQVGMTPGGRLMFNPSGINAPFDIVMTKQRTNMKISSDVMNRVTVGPYDPSQ